MTFAVMYIDRILNDVHTADGKHFRKKTSLTVKILWQSTVLTFQEQDHFLRLLRRRGGCGDAPTTAVRGDNLRCLFLSSPFLLFTRLLFLALRNMAAVF